MCGRITRTSPQEAIAKEFGVTRFGEVDWLPRYNVAPSQIVETIISVNGEKRLGPMRWAPSRPAREPTLAPGPELSSEGEALGRAVFPATDVPPSRFEAVKGR